MQYIELEDEIEKMTSVSSLFITCLTHRLNYTISVNKPLISFMIRLFRTVPRSFIQHMYRLPLEVKLKILKHIDHNTYFKLIAATPELLPFYTAHPPIDNTFNYPNSRRISAVAATMNYTGMNERDRGRQLLLRYEGCATSTKHRLTPCSPRHDRVLVLQFDRDFTSVAYEEI